MNTSNSPVPLNDTRGASLAISVTREMLFARTREMAVAAGRKPLQVTQRDYEQARVELTGESDMERQEAVLDASSGLMERASKVADWENEGGAMAPGRAREENPAS